MAVPSARRKGYSFPVTFSFSVLFGGAGGRRSRGPIMTVSTTTRVVDDLRAEIGVSKIGETVTALALAASLCPCM